MEYIVQDRTYYGHGFGLSEESGITIRDSSVRYLKLDDRASCRMDGGIVGEFGTTSEGESILANIELRSLILTYEKTWLQIDQKL